MKNLCVEACYGSLNKKNEELCGDRVQIVKSPENTLLVLSDGLGSGVKANILSTLTSKIISTMISRGASIEDTVETIAQTLPVCKVRGLAYSTFMILQIAKDGSGYLVEYDNPPCIYIRDGKETPFDYNEKTIAGKPVRESRFKAASGDTFVIVSDGVTQAGMGETLSFGWGWEAVSEYIAKLGKTDLTPPRLIRNVLGVCKDLYLGKPGDDTTVSVMRLMIPQPVAIFSGPPKNKEDDARIVNDFISAPGIHIVSGGTTSEVLARETGVSIEVDMDYCDSDLPPIASIKGIDLATEGVLTMRRVLEILDMYEKDPSSQEMLDILDTKDGASMLAKILIEKCTDLKLFIGRAINPAHRMSDFPVELRVKSHILDDLAASMERLGRNAEKTYY